MKSSGLNILQPAALTMLSGLAIIVAATLALGSVAQDQSGQSAAMVSRAFRMEMGSSEDEFRLIPIRSGASQDFEKPRHRMPGPPGNSFGQVKQTANPAQEFAVLLSELERVAGNCTVETQLRVIRFHVMHARPRIREFDHSASW